MDAALNTPAVRAARRAVKAEPAAEVGGHPLPTNDFLYRPYLMPGAFTPEECRRVIGLCEELPSKTGLMASAGYHRRECKLSTLGNQPESAWVHEKINRFIDLVNTVWYRFELSDLLEGLQFTRYGKDGKIDWHPDTGEREMSTRKLSITVQLSEPAAYEGGALEFNPMGELADCREQGSAILFPSYLLHRVTPITKGTRYALVAWRHGPPFR